MSEPTRKCPYCGSDCYADWVDVGVGFVQCGPYYCDNCGASEIGAHDTDRDLSAREKKLGWYAPGAPLGSSVNAVGGVPVSHQVAKKLYEMEYHSGTKILDEKEFKMSDIYSELENAMKSTNQLVKASEEMVEAFQEFVDHAEEVDRLSAVISAEISESDLPPSVKIQVLESYIKELKLSE